MTDELAEIFDAINERDAEEYNSELQIKTSYNTALAVDYLNLMLERIDDQVINKEEIKEELDAVLRLKRKLLDAIKVRLEDELRR